MVSTTSHTCWPSVYFLYKNVYSAQFLDCFAIEFYDINPLYSLQILFSSFRRLSFHFVNHFFCCAETFQFDLVFMFILFACALGVVSKRSLPRLMSGSFSPVFSYRSFTVLGLIEVFSLFSSFICEQPVFPATFIGETIFSPLSILFSLILREKLPYIKGVKHIYMALF